jgi:hypothetical protein
MLYWTGRIRVNLFFAEATDFTCVKKRANRQRPVGAVRPEDRLILHALRKGQIACCRLLSGRTKLPWAGYFFLTFSAALPTIKAVYHHRKIQPVIRPAVLVLPFRGLIGSAKRTSTSGDPKSEIPGTANV